MPYARAVYYFSESLGIDRPSDNVWAILIDFPNVPAWENDVLEVRQTSPGSPAPGTTFVARRLFGGRESLIDCRITAWEDGRSVTMELKGGVVRHASVTYAVEPTDVDSCRVSYSIEGQMRPLLAWITPLIPVIGRRLVRGNLANLARLAEGATIA
jgi:carbon monoxide dehydrogenase subunit G